MRSSRFDFLEIGEQQTTQATRVSAAVASPSVIPRSAEICEIIGRYGSGVGEFNALWGLAVDNAGTLFVADTHNHRVQKITESGEVYVLGSKGDEPGRFLFPTGIAVDGIGCLYVSDRSNASVQRFDARGRFMLGIGRRGSAISCLDSPTDIALDSFNNIWIVDTANNRVQQFSPTGRFLQCINGIHGRFSRPYGITVAVDHSLYVADTLNQRIVQLLPERRAIGRVITAEGGFEEPCGIAADKRGNLYVTDAATNCVWCIPAEGLPFILFDSRKEKPSGRLSQPRGIAVSPDEASLYVADSLNHRVVRIGLD